MGHERVLINPSAAALGQRNAIISHASAKHLSDANGTLSIKWMPIGCSTWRTAAGAYRIEGEHFLVLNHGRAYSLAREADEPQESFCPFFARSFVEDVYGGLVRPDQRLLDDGLEAARVAAIEFREQVHDPDAAVVPQLRRMWLALRSGSAPQDWLEDEFHALAECLLRSRADVQRAIDRLPARRAATREELHRRLQRGRAFMHAHYASPLRLEDVARVACLAPHHFHRVFRAAFARTPHQYCNELRLARAAMLLTRTPRPIMEICYEVGFESVGSFSALFHRRTGRSPTAFRRQHADGKGPAAFFARIEKR
jgi:AraC-like DNA-binding protein